jgi:cellulose synthase/poly-beta-1,6-N-acetylglucosamine synthase-like glycosyltransferase
VDAVKFWLAKGKKGATRAKVLAGIACSEEALTIVDSSVSDEKSGSEYATRSAYSRWVQANDSINDLDRLSIRTHIAVLPYTPMISVIAPVSKYSESTLLESFNSVISQIYPYWELCLVFDAAAGPRRSAFIRDWAARDSRIRLAELTTSGSVVGLTKLGLKMATGEFVIFLRNGDRLPEHALS